MGQNEVPERKKSSRRLWGRKNEQKRNVAGENSLYKGFSYNLCHFGRKFAQKQAGSRVKKAKNVPKKGHLGGLGGPVGLTLGSNS